MLATCWPLAGSALKYSGVMDATETLTAAIDAARARDLDTLNGLVDWPLSGAAVVFRGLADDIDAEDRSAVVASGLGELDQAATDRTLTEDVLGEFVPRLVAARQIRPAGPEERGAVLAEVRVPDEVAPGLTEAQGARQLELRDRSARLDEVYVVVGDEGDVPVAWAPDTGRLVFVLD